jgi:hypothetical protein
MSWFFLRWGSGKFDKAQRLPEIKHEFQRDRLRVMAGGPELTCLFHQEDEQSGFVVCGAGLHDDGKRVRMMSVEDWRNWLAESARDVAQLGGHFAVAQWTSAGVRFFNDALGLREIFYEESPDRLKLSTHLQPIAAARDINSLNARSFGGKWCLHIQSDHGSPINEVGRLGPAGRGSYSSEGLVVERTKPSFDYTALDDKKIAHDIIEKIRRFTLFPIQQGSRTTLALSGGVDSRHILAALNDQPRDAWEAFTFGNESDADVRVARLLSEKLNFQLQVVPTSPIDLASAQDFVITTDLFKPISGAYAHLSYRALHPGIIIDGAPGELLRRRLFTKLEHFGAKAVAEHNWDEVTKYLWTEQPDIWNEELARSLREHAREQIRSLGESLPSSTEIGIGNWIDTMFCNTWFSNTNGAEQRRVDGYTFSTSPFLQPSMLRDVFHTREEYRKSGKLSKHVLRSLSPEAAGFPYAKDEVIFPSWTPWYLAKLYGKLAKKRSPVASDQDRFLQEFKTPILDALHSQAVRESALYDHKRLHERITQYYNGVHEHAAFVDWWYSFEVWRAANRVSGWS